MFFGLLQILLVICGIITFVLEADIFYNIFPDCIFSQL